MPFYPSDIYDPTDPGFAYKNVDDETEVNAAYMNYRDYEIKAIEDALGADLVPNTSQPLVSRVQIHSSAPHHLLLAKDEGNVGVGTKTAVPAARLHVAANASGANPEIIRISPSSSPNDDWLSLGFDNNALRGTMQVINDGTSVGPLALNPQGGSVWIGTGTTTPKGTLHVRNGASGVDPHDDADELVVEGDGDEVGVSVLGPNAKTTALIFGTPAHNLGARVRWEHGNKLMRIGTASPDGEVRIDSASSWEAIRIDKSRRVGIGTTQPTAQLHVADHTMRIEGERASAPGSGDGNEGDITWVTSGQERELYVKVKSDTWKKVTLT